MNEILTVEEVAQLLRCTEQTVMEALRLGELPGLKFGREWIVPSAALLSQLNENANKQAAALRLPLVRKFTTPETHIIETRPITRKGKLPSDYKPDQIYTHDQP